MSGQVLAHPGLGYFDALGEAMKELAAQPKSIIVGQGVGCAGTTMTDTISGIPKEKLLEFPVAEELQAGFCLGLALEGWLPVCVYPRWNFVLRAADQIVNHLDRISAYSRGQYNPRVIIRVAIPSVSPFYPGPQHDDDFSDAFESMCRTIKVVKLQTADAILREYRKAVTAPHSTILVEYTKLYGSQVPSGVSKT